MIKTFILERALDLLSVTSDDETRHATRHVQIVSTPNRDNKALSDIVMVATNGHMLCERTFVDKFPGGVYVVHSDQARSIKALLKELPKGCDELDATIQENGDLLLGLIGRGCTITLVKPTFDYPYYTAVIPKDMQNKVAITVNADYLLTLAKLLTDGEKRKSPFITIEFDATNPTKPIMVYGSTEHLHTAVVMPVGDSRSKNVADAMFVKLNPAPKVLKKGKVA